MLHAFPSSPTVCVWRRSEKSRRERGGGTGVCQDQCMVHTDVSSRRQGCREEKGESECWERERGRGRRGGEKSGKDDTGLLPEGKDM